MKVSVGDDFPSGLVLDLPNLQDKACGLDGMTKLDLDAHFKGKKIPGYLKEQAALKGAGIDEIIVFCVNDAAVMKAWYDNQKCRRSHGFITFMADPASVVTKALDMVLDHPGPMAKLGYPRCKRFAMVIDDGKITVCEVSEREDDPAGDDFPESSCADNMLVKIKEASGDAAGVLAAAAAAGGAGGSSA